MAFGKFSIKAVELINTDKLDTNVNRVVVDWFSFTSPTLSVDDIKGLLGLDSLDINWFKMDHGRYGYSFGISFEYINIYYGGSGVMLEMSGKGCRSYDEYGKNDWISLFRCFTSHCVDSDGVLVPDPAYRLKRLDIAYDDFVGVLDIDTMCYSTEKRNYHSLWRTNTITYSCKDGIVGKSVIFGSRSRDVLMRTYDKKVEQGSDLPHWVRMEIQLREQNALSFLDSYCGVGRDFSSVGDVFKSCISKYIKFVCLPDDFDGEPEDLPKSQWESVKWWSDFLGTFKDVFELDKPGTDPSFEKFEGYLFTQNGQPLYTYLNLVGEEGLQDAIQISFEHFRRNPKYDKIRKDFEEQQQFYSQDQKKYLRRMNLCSMFGDYKGASANKYLFDLASRFPSDSLPYDWAAVPPEPDYNDLSDENDSYAIQDYIREGGWTGLSAYRGD